MSVYVSILKLEVVVALSELLKPEITIFTVFPDDRADEVIPVRTTLLTPETVS